MFKGGLMLKIAAIAVGIFLLSFGILGTFPEITPQDHLLGIFLTNKAYNYFRILLGILGLLFGFGSPFLAKNYLSLTGFILAILSIYGYFIKEGMLFGILATNPPVNWLTAALGFYCLFFGLYIGNYKIGRK